MNPWSKPHRGDRTWPGTWSFSKIHMDGKGIWQSHFRRKNYVREETDGENLAWEEVMRQPPKWDSGPYHSLQPQLWTVHLQWLCSLLFPTVSFHASLFPSFPPFLYPIDEMPPAHDYSWNLSLAEQPLDLLVKISLASTWSLVSISQNGALVRIELTGNRHTSQWCSLSAASWRHVLVGNLPKVFVSSLAKLLLNISLKFLNGIALFIFGCIKSSLLHASFSSCGERVSSLVVVLGFLTAVASLAAEHRLWSCGPSVAVACGLSRRGSWALEHRLVAVAHRFCALRHARSSWTRDLNPCPLHQQEDS